MKPTWTKLVICQRFDHPFMCSRSLAVSGSRMKTVVCKQCSILYDNVLLCMIWSVYNWSVYCFSCFFKVFLYTVIDGLLSWRILHVIFCIGGEIYIRVSYTLYFMHTSLRIPQMLLACVCVGMMFAQTELCRHI